MSCKAKACQCSLGGIDCIDSVNPRNRCYRILTSIWSSIREKGPVLYLFAVNNSSQSQSCKSGRICCFWLSLFALRDCSTAASLAVNSLQNDGRFCHLSRRSSGLPIILGLPAASTHSSCRKGQWKAGTKRSWLNFFNRRADSHPKTIHPLSGDQSRKERSCQ